MRGSRWACPVPERIIVHGAVVILSEAKNLAVIWDASEILRFAQNDDAFPTRERLPERGQACTDG